MVQREKATLAGHQHKSRELGKRLDVIGGLEIDLRGLADLAKSIQAQRVLLEEARRNRLDCKRSLEERNIESDSLNARLGVSSPNPKRHRKTGTMSTCSRASGWSSPDVSFHVPELPLITHSNSNVSWITQMTKSSASQTSHRSCAIDRMRVLRSSKSSEYR